MLGSCHIRESCKKLSTLYFSLKFLNLYIYIYMVKYVFALCGLITLFFAPRGSFFIVDGTSFMAKNGESTSVQTFVQKLMKIKVNTSK
jgi:hypothetical protein